MSFESLKISRRGALLMVGLFVMVLVVGCPSEPPGYNEADPELDAGGDVDAEPDDAGDDVECIGESDHQLCDQEGAECGTIEAEDSCGNIRNAVCPDCTPPNECGAGDAGDNECGCEPLTRGDCSIDGALEAECGTHDDGCGGTVECDDCDEGWCLEDDGVHRCDDEECVPTPREDACEDSECGTVGDGCGEQHDCGECDGEYDVCTSDNTCECQSESASQFCDRHDAECGDLEAEDNCGHMRSENCGGCGAFGSSYTCDDDENECWRPW